MWTLPWRTKASSELGIQRGIHPAFNGHSMGEIWHSGFFGSAEPYFSWNGPDQFSGGNFLIIILVGAKDQSLSRMGCTQVPGSRPLLEFYGELVACTLRVPVLPPAAVKLPGQSSVSGTQKCEVFIFRHWGISQCRKIKNFAWAPPSSSPSRDLDANAC